MCLSISLDVVQQWAQVIALLAGAHAAFFGVSAWRRQLFGKTEFEVAKNVLTSLYRLRDATDSVRRPFMSAAELSLRGQAIRAGKIDAPGDETKTQEEVANSYYAYAERFKGVQKAIEDCYGPIIESEAVFGEEARRRAGALIDITHRLWGAVSTYHQIKRSNPQSDDPSLRQYEGIIFPGIAEFEAQELTKEQQEKRRDIRFERDYKQAMKAIETYFRPHTRKRGLLEWFKQRFTRRKEKGK